MGWQLGAYSALVFSISAFARLTTSAAASGDRAQPLVKRARPRYPAGCIGAPFRARISRPSKAALTFVTVGITAWAMIVLPPRAKRRRLGHSACPRWSGPQPSSTTSNAFRGDSARILVPATDASPAPDQRRISLRLIIAVLLSQGSGRLSGAHEGIVAIRFQSNMPAGRWCEPGRHDRRDLSGLSPSCGTAKPAVVTWGDSGGKLRWISRTVHDAFIILLMSASRTVSPRS